MEKELDEVKRAVDSLVFVFLRLNAKISVVEKMVLGVYHDTLPTDNYTEIFSKYIDELDNAYKDAIEQVGQVDLLQFFPSATSHTRRSLDCLEEISMLRELLKSASEKRPQ